MWMLYSSSSWMDKALDLKYTVVALTAKRALWGQDLLLLYVLHAVALPTSPAVSIEPL